MSATKSSYLQLFDNESKDDAYSFLVTNVQSKVSFEDSYTAGTGRPMEFKAKAGYKFYNIDGSSSFDLDARFNTAESDIATNAANPLPAQNQTAIADLTALPRHKVRVGCWSQLCTHRHVPRIQC